MYDYWISFLDMIQIIYIEDTDRNITRGSHICIAGWGPSTAIKLILQHGTLEKVGTYVGTISYTNIHGHFMWNMMINHQPVDLDGFGTVCETKSCFFFQSRVKQRDLSCVHRSLKLLGVALSSSYFCFTVKRPCAEIWGLTKCQKISDTRHDMLPHCRCIQSILPTCWMLMYTSTFNERCVSCSWNATCFFTGSSNVLQRVRGQRHTEHTEPHWTILNHPEPSWNIYWYCERLWKIRIYLRIYHDLMMKSWLTQTFAQLGYAWLCLAALLACALEGRRHCPVRV